MKLPPNRYLGLYVDVHLRVFKSSVTTAFSYSNGLPFKLFGVPGSERRTVALITFGPSIHPWVMTRQPPTIMKFDTEVFY
jgi:hypothetical protein